MKKRLLTVLLFLLAFNFALAQDKGFGVGFIAGNPTGVSLKGWTGKTMAYDAAIAWNFGNNSLGVHADLLWHQFDFIKVAKGKLPLYYGFGATTVLSDDFGLGVRGVVGLDYMFDGVPLDLFLEAAPTFSFLPGTDFDIGFGLGMRYFF